MKITAKGNYSGSLSKTFTIKPAKAKAAVKAGKKKATVKITSQKKAAVTGYQIAYKKAGTSKWKTLDTKKTTKNVTKLSKDRKYYVKARAYKTIDGKKVYGAYSKAVKVKIK